MNKDLSLQWNTHYSGSWLVKGLLNEEDLETYYVTMAVRTKRCGAGYWLCRNSRARCDGELQFIYYELGSTTDGSAVDATINFLPAARPPLVIVHQLN